MAKEVLFLVEDADEGGEKWGIRGLFSRQTLIPNSCGLLKNQISYLLLQLLIFGCGEGVA